ncbi:MAG: hypothetical protein MI702_01755, partial [Chlorobiales bacterium]|nr:hypothetical protein [Chlorobiales bacterium]
MTVKGSVLIAVILFFEFLFRKCSASAQSLLWTFLFVGLLVIPIIENYHLDVLPSFDNMFQDKNYGADSLILLSEKAPNFQNSYAGTSGGQANVAMQPSSQKSNAIIETMDGSGWSSSFWLQLIVTIWSAGVVVFLIRLINGLLNGWLVARTAASPENKMITDSCELIKEQLGIKKPVKLRISGKTKIPFISWLGGPQIVMPLAAENWSRITLGAVLIHELAHVKRFDLFKLILANVVRAFHW